MFKEQLKKGKYAEQIVQKHLEQRGHIINNVSDNPEYWKYDIDLIITNWKEPITIEVKRDDNLYRTGNIFVEVGFQKEDYYSTGWFNNCKADYIAYYDTKTANGLIIELDKLKQAVVNYGKKIYFRDKIDNCDGIAYLLPIGKAKKLGIISHQWKENE